MQVVVVVVVFPLRTTQLLLFVLYLVVFYLKGPDWGASRGQGEASGASAPPALVHPGAERGTGWGPSLDSAAYYPTGDRHTGGDVHTLKTKQIPSPGPPENHLLHVCVSQGCVSCNSGAGVTHSSHPPVPDSSSPLDSPQEDSIGPVVDTWETRTQNNSPPSSQWTSPARDQSRKTHRTSPLTSPEEWAPVL